MAFKTLTEYDKSRYDGLFILRNDKDSANVIFLYRSVSDVLIADAHYIKSADYTGYVHCCGKGCPACAKGIRVQTKLFIPLYNVESGEVQFWDRNVRFENQLLNDVFKFYPNPSEYLFTITRNGASGDINTTYLIQGVSKNKFKSYNEILSENKIAMPDYYNNICKDMDAAELYSALNASSEESVDVDNLPDYPISPRRSVEPASEGIPTPPVFNDLPFEVNDGTDTSETLSSEDINF